MQNPIVVIGSGISGLNFALKVASRGLKVVVLTKKETAESGTNYAQGGIAAVLDQYDSFESHIEDTLKAGSYHNNREAVELVVKEGPKAVADLIEYGVNFQTFEGRLALTREGGHSAHRIAFVGDYTGRDIERALVENVRKNPNINVSEHTEALDLSVSANGSVDGVWYELSGKVEFLASSAVVLATGGIGQLYKYTTNPSISTGDGISMALRAGAVVRDMEFVQFHPTAFFGLGRSFLISEAVRGEGSYLIDEAGERFVDELAPRDLVAQAIFEKSQKGEVFLDCRHLHGLKLRFPTIYEELLQAGLSMEKDLIPIAPAAHYLCGGIETDLNGFSSVLGLYAFGECAYTGVHGANRLASNSLLEALVISSRLAKKIVSLESHGTDVFEKMHPKFNKIKIADLKEIMWAKVGIVRNEKDLKKAVNWIEKELSQVVWTTKFSGTENYNYLNMLQLGREIAKAAINRKQSLGSHLMQTHSCKPYDT